MNWRRILCIIALGAWVLLIGGVIWMGPSPRKQASIREPEETRFGSCHATIVIRFRFQKPDIVGCKMGAPDSLVHSSEMDLNTLVAILRSRKFNHDALASFNSNELLRVLGPQFISNGISSFGGIHIEPIRPVGGIIITAVHRNPHTARLVVEHLYSEFAKYLRKNDTDANEEALLELRRKSTVIIERTQRLEVHLEELRRLQNAESIQATENDIRVFRKLLRYNEDRIADVASSLKDPPPLNIRVIDAHVITGPFWNRTTTDFTTDAQHLTER